MKKRKAHRCCWHVVETSTDIDPTWKKSCGNKLDAGYDDGIMEQCCKCGETKDD